MPEQFEKPMRSLLEAVDQGLIDEKHQQELAGKMEKITADINTHGRNEALPHFVSLADKLYDAALEVAKRQVQRAEALVRQIELEAESARHRAKTLWEDCQSLERDLEDMSSDVLQSFSRYNGARK